MGLADGVGLWGDGIGRGIGRWDWPMGLAYGVMGLADGIGRWDWPMGLADGIDPSDRSHEPTVDLCDVCGGSPLPPRHLSVHRPPPRLYAATKRNPQPLPACHQTSPAPNTDPPRPHPRGGVAVIAVWWRGEFVGAVA